jgi:hypothetical protein
LEVLASAGAVNTAKAAIDPSRMARDVRIAGLLIEDAYFRAINVVNFCRDGFRFRIA